MFMGCTSIYLAIPNVCVAEERIISAVQISLVLCVTVEIHIVIIWTYNPILVHTATPPPLQQACLNLSLREKL